MFSFEVNDMTCGHCVGAITRALQDIDPGAEVQVDLASHRVSVRSAARAAETFSRAIREAGYTPVLMNDAVSVAAAGSTTGRSGCCCR